MSGTTGPARAEHHLGDRLAALVDGELGHEERERVLAHLATCCGCKDEAEAQRRIKNLFAVAAPPLPSDGLLARLQALPATVDEGGGPAGDDAAEPRAGRPPRPALSVLPGGDASGGLLTPQRGFRVHRTPEPERVAAAASRGRRFAFAAAGAVSLAAVALGGALGTAATTGGSTANAGGPGTAPLRPTAGVERPTDRRNEPSGPGVVPLGRGTGLSAASSGPTGSAAAAPRLTPVLPGAAAPYASSPHLGPLRPARVPAAHAPGTPLALAPPPTLRTTAVKRPSPAPGTTPMAVSHRP
ncbi:zf-HC2 domain-containing protein [Streptomyces sp. TRM 70351]|uniref:anti-sigma factor family protein n=1 Tax=Streptomyces sp. TRM 70351 TaxID=3116552 RepID=UPI002E7BAF3B|nr:zf-HC2 domain-containing protein [Streptomyces sp. TRM 70351]MEE1927720.1 zf-HC2 domain-containing protein [Streptomyces sp. TRM 70351]